MWARRWCRRRRRRSRPRSRRRPRHARRGRTARPTASVSDEISPHGDSAAVAGAAMEPMDELSALVTYGAALFYWAEVDENPSVKTYWDAYHYIATSLSVGYANIFPVTPLGKLIGAVVQMIGPALSARALEGLKPSPPDSVENHEVVDRLDAILQELRALNQKRS